MDRKEFIKSCGFACLGLAGLSFLEGCATTNYYASSSNVANSIVVKKSEFIIKEKDKTTIRKYVLVKSDQLNFPICLFLLSSNVYSAVLMECTHKSCELHNQGNFLICPCHGSEFSNTGLVQNPPAEENLITYKTKTDNEHIYIQL